MRDHGGWVRSIEVIPGLNDAARPYGFAVGTTFRSVKGWTESGKREYDYGAIILPSNARRYGRYVRLCRKRQRVYYGGYPEPVGLPRRQRGNQQWFMSRNAKSVSDRVITYDIDTMGGQSGAPVWIKVGEARTCVGVHINGHISGNSATRITAEVFANLNTWRTESA